jgi:rfaE bifunctional protein nucleotidyltransferase chain/domain
MGMIVLCNGCFDGLHIGHVAHLQAARLLGSTLVVGLTADEFVNKGPGRPIFPWLYRRDMLMALRCVDAVTYCTNALEAIELVKPKIYVKGVEYFGKLPEAARCVELGIQVVCLDSQPVYSSTALLSGKLLNDRATATIPGK